MDNITLVKHVTVDPRDLEIRIIPGEDNLHIKCKIEAKHGHRDVSHVNIDSRKGLAYKLTSSDDLIVEKLNRDYFMHADPNKPTPIASCMWTDRAYRGNGISKHLLILANAFYKAVFNKEIYSRNFDINLPDDPDRMNMFQSQEMIWKELVAEKKAKEFIHFGEKRYMML
jgi:hypothetical protein